MARVNLSDLVPTPFVRWDTFIHVGRANRRPAKWTYYRGAYEWEDRP